MSRINKLLGSKRPPSDKHRYNIYLSRVNYEQFQAICAQAGTSASETLDALIADFNEVQLKNVVKLPRPPVIVVEEED